MKCSLRLALSILVVAGPAQAGDAENIKACVDAVKEYTGKDVDEFDVRYEGAFFDYSKAVWPGIECDVKVGTVFNLTVDGKKLIVGEFSGPEAKALYEALEEETKNAISVLRNRESILERRLDEAKERLQRPDPDHSAVEGFVQEGIEKSL